MTFNKQLWLTMAVISGTVALMPTATDTMIIINIVAMTVALIAAIWFD